MTFLYVFPHPDDEAFGPGPAIARQVREGHTVHLLILTKGGATKVRHNLGLSVEEMGEVRARELACSAEVLGAHLTLLDFPDGGLQDLDPRVLEDAIAENVRRIRPDVLVTYAAFGNSGHPDHLVGHAVVKRVFCAMGDEPHAPKRLALFTLVEGEMGDEAAEHLRGVKPERVGARVAFSDEDARKGHEALACYETYREVVEAHQPLKAVAQGIGFELFGETVEAPLDDLTAGIGG